MKPAPPPAGAQQDELLPSIFAALFGAFLGLTLLKFGNPPITEKWVAHPMAFGGLCSAIRGRFLGVWAAGAGRSSRDSGRALELGRAQVVDRVAAGLAGVAIHCRRAVGRSRAYQTDREAFRRVRPLFLSWLFFAEPGAAGLVVLAGFALRLPAGPGGRLGATVRRVEGVAPLLLSIRLSPDEGPAAGVSQEDLQQPHLRDALLPECPGWGAAAAAAAHAGGALATPPAPDAGRPMVPDRGGRHRRAGLPLLVRVKRRLAVDAGVGSDRAVAGALQPDGSR